MARVSSLGSNRSTAGVIGTPFTFLRSALVGLTGAAALLSVASDADAYVVKKTSRGDLVHWEERTVEYTLDPAVERAVARATDATTSAMGSWSGTVGAPELVTAAASADAPTKPTFDQKNGVFFMKSGYAPAGRALAITVLTYDNASGRILDADVIFNGAYSFEVIAPVAEALVANATPHLSNTDGIAHELEDDHARDTVYDLHHVIAHELGHSLGMNDELGRKDALMYRYSAPNDASIRSPAPDDIAGLAELYGSTFEARGNGCGNATVAPKKPSGAASHVAMIATLGFLLFLTLRAKSDRRARLGFVLAAAAAAIALVPDLSGRSGAASASTAKTVVGHARAKVVGTSTAIEHGVFKTTFDLATTECRRASCPKAGHGTSWGGTIGNITQEVGGHYAPMGGDEVDVSFASLPSSLGTLTKPLAGRFELRDAAVAVLTRAN